MLHFAGYEWKTKETTYVAGPGENYWSGKNAYVKGSELHLRLAPDANGRWQAAEVICAQSFGHGTYRFKVKPSLANIDRNVALGLFTWSDQEAYGNREIDIEFFHWVYAGPTNVQYVVQPFGEGKYHRFPLPAGNPLVHEFTWSERSVVFKALRAGSVVAEWTYEGNDVPPPHDERVHMNLYLYRGAPAPADHRPIDIAIQSFEFRR